MRERRFGHPSGMSIDYPISLIDSETTDQVYPIVSSIIPPLSIDEWRRVCQRSLALESLQADDLTRETVAIARAPNSFVRGVSIYVMRRRSPYGAILDVPVFFAASAVDAEGVAAEMLNYLWAVGRRLDISGLRIWSNPAKFWHLRHDPALIKRDDLGVFLPRDASEDIK